MTIGIDIRVLGSPQKSGVQEYTEQLLAHLLPLDPAIQYNLFYSSYSHSLPQYSWLSLPNVHLLQAKIPNRGIFYAARFFNAPKIDRLLGGVDVFFSPHFFLAPLSAVCRRVTTFHDLSFERFPEFFSWRKRLWHRLEMRPQWQAKFSDRIIAVSESTKHDLVELYGIDPAKIEVIYSGIAPQCKPLDEQALDEFRKLSGLPRRFILSVGTLEPRKNTLGLIRAFEQVCDTSGYDDVQLVIAGPRGWLYDDIFAAVQRSSYRQRIRFVDEMDDSQRAYYYGAASVFVYPSFFEGFGLPVVEAMACKVPVIASHTSSLPEVAGDGALLVDPYDIGSLAQAIMMVLSDERLRNKLVQNGSWRAASFSWEKAAQQTLNVLKRAM